MLQNYNLFFYKSVESYRTYLKKGENEKIYIPEKSDT